MICFNKYIINAGDYMENIELYDANYDEKLIKLRNNCKDKCFRFNNTLPSDKIK